MIKVLMVGKNSYIGNRLFEYITSKNNHTSNEIEIKIDIVDSYNEWKEVSYNDYDSVIFVAGIAHRKQTPQNRDLYYLVNRDLALEVAKKATEPNTNIKQFIYLSSMSVYGKKVGEIAMHTTPTPRHNDYYGQSKYEAETLLSQNPQINEILAIVRPPMVYGAKCPGKFGDLVKFSKYMPIIPNAKNKRSMIYIDNLCEFLYSLIIHKSVGVFCPQNPEYTNTSELVKLIRKAQGKNTLLCPGKIFMNICAKILPPINTAFGTLYYTKELSATDNHYQLVNLEDSVRHSIV